MPKCRFIANKVKTARQGFTPTGFNNPSLTTTSTSIFFPLNVYVSSNTIPYDFSLNFVTYYRPLDALTKGSVHVDVKF